MKGCPEFLPTMRAASVKRVHDGSLGATRNPAIASRYPTFLHSKPADKAGFHYYGVSERGPHNPERPVVASREAYFPNPLIWASVCFFSTCHSS